MLDILKILIGALAAYTVPKLLEPVLKGGDEAESERLPWVVWLIAHAIAGAAGGLLSAALGMQGLDGAGGVANWAGFGLCLGLAQWLVLEQREPLSPLWVVGSTVGWASCAWTQLQGWPEPFVWLLAGTLVGLLQWPILHRRRRRAAWWVPTCAAGAFLGGMLGHASGLAMAASGMTIASAWILGWSIVALIMSCITGFTLSRLPRAAAGTAAAVSP